VHLAERIHVEEAPVGHPLLARLGAKSAQAETSSLLEAIPTGVGIWDAEEHLTKGHAAWQLWDVLHGMKGLGDTTTSKLLAAKRPHLIPIWDSVVGEELFGGDVNGYWEGWTSWFAGDDGKALRGAYDGLRTAEVPAFVSTLRLVDVVVWMHRQRRAAAS